MSRLRFFLLVSSIALALVALVWWLQPPSYIESFPAPKAGPFPTPEIWEGNLAIEGFVRDGQGAPIAGAWITATGIKRIASAACDEKGRFQVGGLAPGTFEITAAAPGFRPASASIKAGEGTITLGLQPLSVFGGGPNPPASSQERFQFTCKIAHEGGSSAGFVAALVPEDIRIPAAIVRTPIDATGIFQVANIPPGPYTLRILSAARDIDLDFSYATVPVEFGPDKTAPDLVSFRTREIRGTVIVPPVPDLLPQPPEWSPLEGAVVRITLLSPSGVATEAGLADTDAQGRFEFRNLPEGDYRVDAFASEFERLTEKVESARGSLVELKLALVRKRP